MIDATESRLSSIPLLFELHEVFATCNPDLSKISDGLGEAKCVIGWPGSIVSRSWIGIDLVIRAESAVRIRFERGLNVNFPRPSGTPRFQRYRNTFILQVERYDHEIEKRRFKFSKFRMPAAGLAHR